MEKSEYKIIEKSSEIDGNTLLLPRAIAIYRAANCQRYVEVLGCSRCSDKSEIIKLRLNKLSIPDEPIFKIQESEEVAIVCQKKDMQLPEVYALRQGFPIGLPHTNVRSFSHPVSMCVSDVSFSDMRLQFNAYDFLFSIRTWFNKNCIGELHEVGRPLEVYFQAQELCTPLNIVNFNTYGKYEEIFPGCSRLKFTNKLDEATHFVLAIIADVTFANNIPFLPVKMADLKTLRTSDGSTLYDSIAKAVSFRSSKQNSLQIIVILQLPEKKKLSNKIDRTELFMFRVKAKACDIYKNYRNLRNQKPDAYTKWYDNIPISIACLLPPSSLLFNRICNGIDPESQDLQQITIIGTGTLGSNIIDSFIRKGACEKIAIVDNDVLLPHNIARHVLTSSDVMYKKTISLRRHYSGIDGQKIISIDKNYFELNDNDKKRLFKDATLIIDVSTSVAVERSLAVDSIGTNCRRATIFLNPGGNQIILMLEDNNRKFRLDLLEMDFQRQLIINDKLSGYLENVKQITSNQFTCRSESFVIDYDNVKILSSVVSKVLLKELIEDEALLNIWTIDKDTCELEKINLPINTWKEFKVNNVIVYVSSEVEKEIKLASLKNKDKETGGCLFGCYDKDRNIIYIIYAVDAPSDSIKSPKSFIRGSKGMVELACKIKEKTYNQVFYIGEWHTHPKFANRPSADDEKQFETMSNQMQTEDMPFVQVIFGVNGLYINAKM